MLRTIVVLPTYDELTFACRAGKAQRVVDKIHHEEIVFDGVRYFCGWSSQKRPAGSKVGSEPDSNPVIGWVVYKAEPESKVRS